MKVTIQGHAKFLIPLEEKHVAILEKLAERHYDARCRQCLNGEPNKGDETAGMIQSWRNTIWFNKEFYNGEPIPVSMSETQIDIAQKIMEYPIGLTDEEKTTLQEFRYVFSRIRREYHKLYEMWRVEIDCEIED